MENTTDKTLKRVRVEVHLSNGKELGPTTPADLDPGRERDVRLTATNKGFDGWTAHPEVGSSEHGRGDGHVDMIEKAEANTKRSTTKGIPIETVNAAYQGVAPELARVLVFQRRFLCSRLLVFPRSLTWVRQLGALGR